jgi:hypothetical protein
MRLATDEGNWSLCKTAAAAGINRGSMSRDMATIPCQILD